jgi:hypothetical protein
MSSYKSSLNTCVYSDVKFSLRSKYAHARMSFPKFMKLPIDGRVHIAIHTRAPTK